MRNLSRTVKGESPVIDVFNHVYPKEYLNALEMPDAHVQDTLEHYSSAQAFTDMEYRIKAMDRTGVDMQILSLGLPTLDDLKEPVQNFPKIARAANDGVSKIVEQYPDRFRGIGTVSLTDVGAAVDEVDRCVNDLGLYGIQVLSNTLGKPLDSADLDPFYERLSRHGIALWVHPAYMRKIYDWVNEFDLNKILGWEIDISLAMFRLVRGGVMDRFPKLNIITHHMGVLIPFMASRIERFLNRQISAGTPPPVLARKPMDYMKSFYVDTAEGFWMPALSCSLQFFGAGHMMFASDFPYAPEAAMTNIINTVNRLELGEKEKSLMLGGNAKALLKIS